MTHNMTHRRTNIHTKREPIGIETGIRDMTHNMAHRRINMLCRLETTNSKMITSILEIENPKTWKNSTIKIMQDMGINPNITTKKKTQQK